MANNSGKSALRMECPHCGTQDEHPVVRTDPKHYHWLPDMAPLFMRLVGRDISFRKRIKRCNSCESTFESVEMARDYLSALIREVHRLSAENERAVAALGEAGTKIERIQDAVNQAAAVLVPLKTKRLNKRQRGRVQK